MVWLIGIDKTIKLWKVHNKKLLCVTNLNAEDVSDFSKLKIPSVSTFETIPTASCKQIYSNAHAYHINSLSLNSDSETFISADDLRINLWNFNVPDQCFSVFSGLF